MYNKIQLQLPAPRLSGNVAGHETNKTACPLSQVVYDKGFASTSGKASSIPSAQGLSHRANPFPGGQAKGGRSWRSPRPKRRVRKCWPEGP